MTGEKLNRLIIAVISTVVLMAVYGLSQLKLGEASFLTRFDAPVQDYFVRVRNTFFDQPISPEVTVLALDDYTMKRLGKFGQGIWLTRQPFIDQLPYYLKYKPTVIAYDLQFLDEEGENVNNAKVDTTNPQVAEELRQVFGALIRGEQVSDNARLLMLSSLIAKSGNKHLGTAFGEFAMEEGAPTLIFAYKESENRSNNPWRKEDILGPGGISEDDGNLIPYLRDVRIPLQFTRNLSPDFRFTDQRFDLPTPSLLDNGRLGYIHVPRDPDGVVRSYPLVWGMKYSFINPRTHKRVTREFLVPSLALLACMTHLGIDIADCNANNDYGPKDRPVIEVNFGRELVLRPPGRGETHIPIDEFGYMLIDFIGRETAYSNLPFWAVNGPEERVKERLHGNIVFVGVTQSGGADIGPTPVHAYTPWLLVHVSVANDILTHTFIQRLSQREELAILLVFWLILTPGAVLLRPRMFLYVVGGLVLIYLAVVFGSLVGHKYVMPLLGPSIYLIFACMGTVLFRYFTEEKEKQRIRGMFSTMVSNDVMRYMEDHPQSFSLAGERREATMFFSDVAGFTTISESLQPQQLANLLNEYLSPMTEIIMANNGYVDKYEGDAIMAEWGVPFPNPDHAKMGCWSALEQQALLTELRPKFKQDYGHIINVRMGINSGAVSAGNMGSARRFQYTVMGDAVNQAARYEPTNKVYGTHVLIGQSTYELAKDYIVARMLDKVVVMGKTEPTEVYELIAKAGEAADDMLEVMALYDQGLKLHWERRWDEAIAAFEKGLKIRLADGPCKTMIARVKEYKVEPPDDNWQGEYVRESKD